MRSGVDLEAWEEEGTNTRDGSELRVALGVGDGCCNSYEVIRGSFLAIRLLPAEYQRHQGTARGPDTIFAQQLTNVSKWSQIERIRD